MPSFTPQQLAAMTEAFSKALRGPREEAARWLLAAAEAGVDEAQVVYGQMLLEGDGVQMDRIQAARWFEAAARASHPMAMNMLGQCYRHGWGVLADLGRAAEWYHRAAEHGLDWGMFNYANALARGEGISADSSQAMMWFQRAASLGHANAINIVVSVHEREGKPLPADLARAIEHYRITGKPVN